MKSGAILNAPWLSEKGRLVKSTSSSHPHVVTIDKPNSKLYCSDQHCPMYAGFKVCSHVVAVAECSGDLKSFLDAARRKCAPNLSVIANQGLPKGAGRKGGVPKNKRKNPVPIESRSVRPCLADITEASSIQQESNSASSILQAQLQSPVTTQTPIPQSTQSFNDLQSILQSLGTVQTSVVQQPYLTPQPPACTVVTLPASTVSQTSSRGQLVFGTGLNLNMPSSALQALPVVTNSGVPAPTGRKKPNKISKPFTVKLKTKQIKICLSCRKDYDTLEPCTCSCREKANI